jgi:hypothetical protein
LTTSGSARADWKSAAKTARAAAKRAQRSRQSWRPEKELDERFSFARNVNIPRGKPFSSNRSHRPSLGPAAQAKTGDGKTLPTTERPPRPSALSLGELQWKFGGLIPGRQPQTLPCEAPTASRGRNALLGGLSRRSSPAERPPEIARLDTMEICVLGSFGGTPGGRVSTLVRLLEADRPSYCYICADK